MSPTIRTRIFLTITIIGYVYSLPKATIHRTCSTDTCIGPFKIKSNVPIQTAPIKITENEAIKYEYPERVEIGIIKRRRLTIYCYDGTSIDPNTGCDEIVRDLTPKVSIAREWIAEGLCKTGFECRPDGECWGSDAKKCFMDNEIVDRGPKQMKYFGERWMKFPSHTCVSSWECFNSKSEVKVSTIVEGNEIKIYYQTKDGEINYINEELFTSGIRTMDGTKHYLLERPPPAKVTRIRAKCYSSSLKNVYCAEMNEDNTTATSFRLGGKMIGTSANKVYLINKPITATDGSSIYTLEPVGNTQNGLLGREIELKKQKSVSIETAMELISSISIIQLQEIYNTEMLAQSIQNIERVLNTLVSEVSKINPKILPKILLENGQANWLTSTTFEICSCIDLTMDETADTNSNCMESGKTFENGYMKETDVTDLCKTFQPSKTKEVSIFKPPILDVLILRNPPPEESSSDSNAWESLNRDRIQSNLRNYTHSNSEQSIITSFYDLLPFGYSVKEVFIMGTCIVFWLCLIRKGLVS